MKWPRTTATGPATGDGWKLPGKRRKWPRSAATGPATGDERKLPGKRRKWPGTTTTGWKSATDGSAATE